MEVIARNKPARSNHDKEWCKIEKQHAAGGGRPDQAAIDQQKFEREQDAGENSGGKCTVTLEQRNAARLRPGADQKRRDNGSRRGLRERGNVVDRKLDRDIIEAPAQAQSDRDCDRSCIERARRGRGRHCHFRSAAAYRSRQCAQMPAISTSGLRGEKPAAREDALSASAAAPPGASPTAPQRSQIRKMTRSPVP